MSTRKRITYGPANEEALAQAWLSGGWNHLDPADVPISVIYPGRRRRTSGPDFIDAIVSIAGQRLTGAVEVHVDAGDWYHHQHHLDPAYNSTILHVVIRGDNAILPVTADGRVVAQARLPMTAINISEPSPVTRFPCRGHDISSAVKTTGTARFREKTWYFKDNLRFQSPGEVLYRGIADALGYLDNRSSMGVLTEAITLSSIIDGRLDRHLALLKAVILWSSGLLAESPIKDDIEARRLRRLVPDWMGPPIMGRDRWCFTRVRPVNSPVRRLVALAHLIHRHHASHLCSSLLGPLLRNKSTAATVQTLREKLVITGHGYWSGHWDFKRPLPRPYSLLGTERASAIAANIVLPFACALGQISGDAHLAKAAIDVYRAYPAQYGNEVTRYMSQLLSHRVETVCEEQGLIHIYRNWCREKRCEECPAGNENHSQEHSHPVTEADALLISLSPDRRPHQGRAYRCIRIGSDSSHMKQS